MLDYLIERENDEMLRTDTRELRFPDGESRNVEAYRLVWSWFDRCVAYEFAPDADRLLHYTLRCEEEEGLETGHALGRVVNHFVRELERCGADLTDEDLPLLLARRQMEKVRARNHQSE